MLTVDYFINLLMEGFQACVANNGNFSEFFDVTRSTHQGDPVAPYLFLICGEVMSIELKKRANIRGVTVNDLETIILQFADDTQLLLKNKKALNEAIRTLTLMEANIGLVVSYEKSRIYVSGDTQKCEINKPIPWDTGGPNLLGIDLHKTNEELYLEILNNIKGIINSWKHRGLTLMGKCMLINTLMGSLFVYKMQVLENPTKKIYKEYEKLIHEYLWGKNKRAKIKSSVLTADKNKGGLRLVHLEQKNQSLKIAWLFRLDTFLQNQIHEIPPSALGQNFWDCTIRPVDVFQYLSLNTNQFWKEVSEAWFSMTWNYMSQVETIEDVHKQVIWCNHFIQIGGKMVLKPELANKGIIYIYLILLIVMVI